MEEQVNQHNETKRAVVALVVLAIFGVGFYFYTQQSSDSFEPEGYLVATGALYDWEVVNGLAHVTIKDDNGNRWKYTFYLGDDPEIVEFTFKDDDETKKRKVSDGLISEIENAGNISIYLKAPYSDARRIAETIVYWN